MKLVSVVIPTYNRREFLEDTVKSVEKQSHGSIETVVIDGGSSDRTTEYLDSLEEDMIKVIARERPKGQSNARNKGIEKAEGDYILFLDDDDRLYENAVEKMVQVLEGLSEEYAGVYTAEERFGEVEEIKSVSAGKSEKVTDLSFGTSCTMFKSDIFEELGGFDENLDVSEDLEFIIRLFSEGYSLYGLDEALYQRRVHEDQLTRNLESVISANYRILEMHEDKLSTLEKFERYEKISRLYIQLEEHSEAVTNIQKSRQILEDNKDEIDPIEILERYERISRLYIQIEENEKAVLTIKESEKLLEINTSKLGNEERQYFFKNISNLYKALENEEMTKTGLESVLDLLENHEDNFENQYLLYRRLGIKFAETGNNKKARQCFKVSINKNPLDRFSYYYYFWVLFGEKGYRKGREIEDLLKSF